MNLYQIDKLKALRGTDSIYNAMLNEMQEQAESYAATFKDSPDALSEWGHNYFCETDGERLIFDLNKPQTHQCGLCGKIYMSKKLDNVWTYFYRNEAILTLMKLAVLYKVDGNEKHLESYKKILSFYAENYESFALHAKDKVIEDVTYDVGGAGRLMPQGLNEAIVLIRITTSMEILKGVLDDAFIAKVTEGLFKPAVSILRPQLVRIHNIPCWINAALGVVGLYTHDQELVDAVYNGEFGINAQLKQGVTADKFWYEGSIHYNFFLLEGVVNLLVFSRLYDQPVAEQKVVEEMLAKAYQYAFNNDVFPNPNDGWPNMNLKSYEYIYSAAAKVFGEDSEVGNIYKNILRQKSPRGVFPLSKPYYYENEISFERLIYFPTLDVETATPIERKSYCYENSYFSMLRNDTLNVFMKYGHQGPSHAHPDKMTLEVTVNDKVLTRDLSNSGYAAVLCNEWHRMSLSHNTVIVDGKNQVSMEGGVVKAYDENTCHSFVKDVYPGVDYTRAIDLATNGYNDTFTVASEENHTYDWIFHSQATLLTQLELEDAELGFTENGYQHVQEVKRVMNAPAQLVLDWDLDGTALKSTIQTENHEIFIAKTYDNPVSHYRTAIILRDKTNNVTFTINWEVL